MENSEVKADSPMVIDSQIKEHLTEASKWGKFLAILGYIVIGLLMLTGILMVVIFSSVGKMTDLNFPIGLMSLIYIIIAAIYVIPVNYLYRFSTKMKQGLSTDDSQAVTSGFANLKALFKFVGVFTIIVLALYVLIFLVAIIAGAIAGTLG